jgi:hypothetical protein
MKPIGVLCLLSSVICLLIGAAIKGWRWEARVEAREADILRERIAVYAIARSLEAAGEEQARKLLAQEAANRKLGKEKDDAIRKLATGRACLGADLVGLLNDGAESSGPGLSAPAGGLAYPAAAAATDSGIRSQESGISETPGIRTAWATDADVALWIRFAREQYDVCRRRIDALNEFFTPAATPPVTFSDPRSLTSDP